MACVDCKKFIANKRRLGLYGGEKEGVVKVSQDYSTFLTDPALIVHVCDADKLYTLLAIINDAPYPLLHAVTRCKKRATYQKIFTVLKNSANLVPGNLQKLRSIRFLIDFEEAVKCELESVLRVEVRGCLFHTSQAINRNAKKIFKHFLNERRVSQWVGRARAACFLPPHIIEALGCFEIPYAITPGEVTLHAAAARFTDYLRNTWLIRFR
ncbi:unnamed protein product, partial [Mesorhabditis spiculigera]